ncbi:glycosyltransferase [Salinimonas chungwhensis]|uniref:glycosyltransferase n=1 Tax=Salinimonas chungwhensis TaxID=265425 RepID=UPI00036C56E7|nr:glycosyltransferase [Salinimonas chungwhensis]
MDVSNTLSQANNAFRKQDYKTAVKLYQQYAQQSPEHQQRIVVNLKLAEARLNRQKERAEQNTTSAHTTEDKIIVYTVNIGGYESVKEPTIIDPTVEYILFTDNKDLVSEHWKIIQLTDKLDDPRRTSRLPKILAHKYLPEHDVSVYIDSSLEIKTPDVRKMISDCMEGYDIALYKHYKRKCVYDEIEFVMNSTDRIVANKDLCLAALKKYEDINYPRGNGLFENAFIFRRNTEKNKKLNNLWWKEYIAGTERDQFTFMYALEVEGAKPNPIKIGKQFRINPYVNFHKHVYKSHSKPKKPHVFIAYAPKSYGMNLGRCYNEYMERLGDDDYALFIDHDAMFTNNSWRDVVASAYSEHAGETALFISRTNRINNPYQRLNLLENNHNLFDHDVFATNLAKKYGKSVVECAKLPSSSGVIIMLSKKTWLKHKFTDGFLKVDNNIHLSHRNAGDPVYIMQGLHVYHFYRADNDLSHAVKDISSLPKESTSKIGHVVRNFVTSDLSAETLAKYMNLLNDDEYGVFLPEQAMFCNKDWYTRVCEFLEKDHSVGLMVFNNNFMDEKAPLEFDVVKHKQYAASLLESSSYCALDYEEELAQGGLSAFLLSKKAWKELEGQAQVDFKSLATAVSKAKQKARFIKNVYVLDKNKDHREKVVSRYLNNQLNIAVLTFGFWPQQAGMEMMVNNLSSQLTKAGNNVVLFAPKPKKDYEELKSNYIIRRFKSTADMKRIFKEHHASMPFDVIYVQGAYEPASLALELKKELGVPVVLRTHGEDIQIDKESNYGYRLDPAKNEVILRNIREVDHNVVIGPHIYEEVRPLTNGSISLIYNGVDTEHFTPGREYLIHDKFNLPRTTKILITVGRNVQKKSLHLAIDALAELRKERQDVVLVHAGKEGNGLNLVEYAKEKGVEDFFFQLGEISYFDMPSIYRSSDIFVFPAKTETFGNVTVEAMACGLPAVEFDYSVNHHKIKDNYNGFIVPYRNVDLMTAKIEYLLNEQAILLDFSKKARDYAIEKFSWLKIRNSYESIFKKQKS